MIKKIALLIGFASASFSINAQTFYDTDTIQKIELQFSQSNWDYMMDTANAGSENYIIAQYVRINGIQYDSVGKSVV